MKKLSLLAACFVLSAWTSINQTKTVQSLALEELTIKELVSACNTTDLNLQEVSDKHKVHASKYAIYAMLSNNAYDDERYKFILPDNWKEVRRLSDTSGLDYQLYEKTVNQKVVEAVMVFQGTAGLIDWTYGNLSSKQYKYAKSHIESLSNYYMNKGIPFKATGHSLGGGLALYASYQFDEIEAIGFNSSPRYHSKKIKKTNNRFVIFEKGEPNRIAGNIIFPWRWSIFEDEMNIKFYKYNFQKRVGLRNHQSTRLAKGLLLSGSLVDPDLRKTLIRNCNEDSPEI